MTDPEDLPGEGGGLEADLLAVAERRDREAFGRLFAFYGPRVKAYLGRLGVGEREADESAQEALLAVWREAPRFDPRRAALSTWVFAIVRERRALAASAGGRPEFDPEDPALVGDADGAAPTGNADVLRLVRRAVDRLPAEQVEVLRAFYHEERPRPAAAAEAPIPRPGGIPAGAEGSRLRLALGRLRGGTPGGGGDG
jgi:RNA polymerase sigma-70 factor, ECF subfamily